MARIVCVTGENYVEILIDKRYFTQFLCGNIHNPAPMKLLMYISNDLIDSVPLEKSKIVYPGYIRRFTRILKEKHDTLIRQSPGEPEFLIHDFSTEANVSACTSVQFY
jgi:hypothetical protein